MLPTLCGPYRNSCWFDHSSICIFLCFPGVVEASNDHAVACFKLLLVVPDSVRIKMCSAEVALGHIVLPVVSFPPLSIIVQYQCSLFVVVIQALLYTTGNLPKRASSDLRTEMCFHIFKLQNAHECRPLLRTWYPVAVTLLVCESRSLFGSS